VPENLAGKFRNTVTIMLCAVGSLLLHPVYSHYRPIQGTPSSEAVELKDFQGPGDTLPIRFSWIVMSTARQANHNMACVWGPAFIFEDLQHIYQYCSFVPFVNQFGYMSLCDQDILTRLINQWHQYKLHIVFFLDLDSICYSHCYMPTKYNQSA